MRKNTLTVLLVLLLVLVVSLPAAASDIRLQLDGELLALDVPPVVESGRTLIPARAITEKLGATVDWDPVTRRVEITLSSQTIVLTIDSDTAYVNGAAQILDVPARIVDGRTLVPARFLSENLNCTVDWDATARLVTITSKATLPVAPEVSVSIEQMEAEVLAALNAMRGNLGLSELRRVEELNTMARSHASDMAATRVFGHTSASYGNTAARAEARGLAVHVEYLAYGLPDGEAIANTMLSGEQGSLLLSEEASFVGIGLYQSGSGNNSIYAVVELVSGEGMLLGSRQQSSGSESLTVTGYAQSGAVLTVYLLDGDGTYLSRESQTLSVGGNGSFSTTVSFWERGSYAIMLGNDRILVEY